MFVNLPPWPASVHSLEEWSAQRLYGGNLPKQGRIELDTLLAYLSSLRSYHIDHSFLSRSV